MSTGALPTPVGYIVLPDEAATQSAGRALGRALEAVPVARHASGAPGRALGAVAGAQHAGGALIAGLAGGLGAGKTTLARAALRELGVAETVRSPTYTIAEPYDTRIGRIWHLDLYRIADPDELEFIAIRDLVSDSVACLVEWPERGRGGIPEPDCLVTLAVDGFARRLRIEPRTPRGDALASRVHICSQPESLESG